MGVFLDVPFANQLMRPGQSTVLNDPAGCWYASLAMIAAYFDGGPPDTSRRGPLPLEIRNQLGFQPRFAKGATPPRAPANPYHGAHAEHVRLTAREKLEPIPNCARNNYNYGGREVEQLLRRHGPAAFFWLKTLRGRTYGHIGVLVGIGKRETEILFHDPENAATSTMTLDSFNQLRQRWMFSLLRRAGHGHTIRGHSIA